MATKHHHITRYIVVLGIVVPSMFAAYSCTFALPFENHDSELHSPSPEPSFVVDYVAAPGYVPNCTQDAAASLVSRFVDRFNDGDRQGLSSLFPEQSADVGTTNVLLDDPSLFQQYVVNADRGGPQSFAAYNREDALGYVAERHEQNEILQIRELTVIPRSKDTVIQFELERRADDVPATLYAGKGGINCDQGTIYLWVMAPAL